MLEGFKEYLSEQGKSYIFSRLCPSRNSFSVALQSAVNVPALDRINRQSGRINRLRHVTICYLQFY